MLPSLVSTDPPFIIRTVHPSDYEALKQISVQTAAEQNPLTTAINNPEFISDVLISGYLELEPELFYVVETEGQVVGYLTGSDDSNGFARRYMGAIFPRIALNFFKFGIFKNIAVLDYLLRAGLQATKNSGKRNKAVKDFPAHFHINLLPDYRRYGWGGQLVEIFLNELRSRKVKGVHLATISDAGKNFFKKSGFDLTLALPSTVFPDRKTELWIMTKKI